MITRNSRLRVLALPALFLVTAPSGCVSIPQERQDAYGDSLPEGALLRIGTVRMRDYPPVYGRKSVVFYPSGEMFATVSSSGVLRIWDVTSGRMLRGIDPSPSSLFTCLAAPSSKPVLAAADYLQEVRLWDVCTGKEMISIPRSAESLAFSHDGTALAVGTVGELSVWDVATGRRVQVLLSEELDVFSMASDVSFAPDGKTLAALLAQPGGRIMARVCDVATGQTRLRLDVDPKFCSNVQFSSDGKLLAIGGKNAVRVWDVASWKELPRIEVGTDAYILRLSPDGRMMAYGGGDVIHLREFPGGKSIGKLAGHEGKIVGLAFSPDGKMLASTALDGTIRLWDVARQKEALPFAGPQHTVSAIALSPDGKSLVSCGGRMVRVWDAVTGGQIACLESHVGDMYACAWSRDGRRIATVGEHNVVVIWDLETGQAIMNLGDAVDLNQGPSKPYQEHPRSLTFSEKGDILAAWGEGVLRVWDLASGQIIRQWQPNEVGRFGSVAFSPDLKLLAGTGDDFDIRLWEMMSGREVCTLSGSKQENISSIAFSPDGKLLASGAYPLAEKLLASGSKGTVEVWEVATRKMIMSWGASGNVCTMDFSPDGSLLAVGSTDGRSWILDVKTGRESRSMATGPCVTFSSNGQFASAGPCTNIIMWDLSGIKREQAGSKH